VVQVEFKNVAFNSVAAAICVMENDIVRDAAADAGNTRLKKLRALLHSAASCCQHGTARTQALAM
jgi:hypothetical protein